MLFDPTKITCLDGAMGTMLLREGIDIGKVPEALNITRPEAVTEIHRRYIGAGAEVVYANTFAANRYKLAGSGYTVHDLVSAGVACARAATSGTGVKVALDVGPVGELLAPGGSLAFQEAYDIFKEIVISGERAGADLVVFETIVDLLEMKAALLAAKENTSLPVFCTMTFEENGRTFTGVTVASAAVTLTALGADAIGINCSLGPNQIFPLVKEMAEWTPLPLIVKPNAGLPNLDSNAYDITPDAFLDMMEPYFALGVQFVGGCCGTTPAYIRKLSEAAAGLPARKRTVLKRSALCSANRVVAVDRIRIVGERINPTGKKVFKEALQNKNIGYIQTLAIDQVAAGADILDVNVGLPGIDEKAMMAEAILALQSVVDAPLQIDSSDADVIEAGLRLYNGKPIVNSVNGEEEALSKILPLVKKYGAAVVGLTLDENGIPETAEERFSIAKKIVDKALAAGIDHSDIYIDCLTLTASVQQKEAFETLRAITMVKERLGVKTLLGVSNISFGLPNRELINTSFLTLAMAFGLDLAIINPNAKAMTDAIDAFLVLSNYDRSAASFIARHNAASAAGPASLTEITLDYAICKGLKEYARGATLTLLTHTDPLEIVQSILIPALDQVGEEFNAGTIFLPQLIQSAMAAQAAFEVMKESLAKNPAPASLSKGKIILATVRGDIHDIGKNIVKVILENYGYQVIDLGKDVPIERVVQETRAHKAKLVGLSALMTTTVANMEKTIQALRQGCDCKVMVGGAVLTRDYALKMGADFFAKDAKQAADIAKTVLG